MAISTYPSFYLCNCSSSASPAPGRQCKYSGQAVRALPTRIITVGKKRSRGVQLVVDDYINKLKPYCSVDDIQIRSNPKSARDVRVQVDDEDMAAMNLITVDDWVKFLNGLSMPICLLKVVILDEDGLDIGSEQMAELVAEAGNTGASRLSFCIGGPYGHGQRIRRRANGSIRLSSMVLNHQIALLVFIEQLYRSWTMLKGQNYHH